MANTTTKIANDSVILVTGGNKGIGYEIVRLLSEQHPNCIILLGARNIELGNNAVKQLNKSNIHFIHIDATDKNSIQEAYSTINDKYKRLDILINNAGVLYYSR